MAVNITKLKKQLMDRIDENDLVQVEKVERYIKLVRRFNRINTIINKEGESITTENGSQRFTKAHPLIGEQNKINASLIALGKDLGLSNSKPPSNDEGNYNSSDLI